MIDVYHFDVPPEIDNELKQQLLDIHFGKLSAVYKAIEQGHYLKVASVPIDNLEVAFKLTNSIDSYWADNPDLTIYKEKLRSTSVGDVMSINKELYLVSSIGFTKLSEGVYDKLIDSQSKTRLKLR